MLPSKVTRLGVARTFQNIRLFNEMTALENVMVGQHCRTQSGVLRVVLRTPRATREEKDVRDKSLALLEYVGLGGHAGELAKNLPYGSQRRLEIARALATEPTLLFLDEPAAGMNPQETASLMHAHPPDPRRRHDHHPHRARHEGGHGQLGPHRRARPRREDRRGLPRTSCATTPRSSKPTWGRARRWPPATPTGRRGRRGHAGRAGHPRLLRQHRGAQGRLSADQDRGDRHADRRQRRRQEHDAQRDLRAAAPALRQDLLRGPGPAAACLPTRS